MQTHVSPGIVIKETGDTVCAKTVDSQKIRNIKHMNAIIFIIFAGLKQYKNSWNVHSFRIRDTPLYGNRG